MTTLQDWYASDEVHQQFDQLFRANPIIGEALDVLRSVNAPSLNYGTDPVSIALLHAEQAGFNKAIQAFERLRKPPTNETPYTPKEWVKRTNG